MYEMKVRDRKILNQHYRPIHFCNGFELEYICWDPKAGELCVCSVKPKEPLVEARSDTNVQIVRLTYV